MCQQQPCICTKKMERFQTPKSRKQPESIFNTPSKAKLERENAFSICDSDDDIFSTKSQSKIEKDGDNAIFKSKISMDEDTEVEILLDIFKELSKAWIEQNGMKILQEVVDGQLNPKKKQKK